MKFKAFDRVKVIKCSGSDIEGKTGTVLGTTYEGYGSYSYFILFDEDINSDFPGLSLTEHLLEKI